MIPSETAVLKLVSYHTTLMSDRDYNDREKYSIRASLTALAYSAAQLLEIGSSKLADNAALTKKTLDLIVPALVSCHFTLIKFDFYTYIYIQFK